MVPATLGSGAVSADCTDYLDRVCRIRRSCLQRRRVRITYRRGDDFSRTGVGGDCLGGFGAGEGDALMPAGVEVWSGVRLCVDLIAKLKHWRGASGGFGPGGPRVLGFVSFLRG